MKNDLFPYTKKLKAKSKCVLWILLGFSENDLSCCIGSVYIPGESSKFVDLNDFDIICEDVTALSEKYNCPFVLMGDFNARSGKLCDFFNSLENTSETEIKRDLIDLGIVTDRYNMDKKVDTHGRKLIKLCRDLNFKIVNGRFGTDSMIGQFTCLKPTGKSLVDYALVSDCLLPCICNFYVDTFDRCMSDVHVPLCLNIKITNQAKNTDPSPPYQNTETRKFSSVWKPELKGAFQNGFSETDIMQLSESISRQQMSGNSSKEEIEKLVSDLTSLILKPAKQLGLCKKNRAKNKPRKYPRKPWFNSDCESKRKMFFKAKNSVWEAKNQEEKELCLTNTKQRGKEYKLFISSTQKNYCKNLHKNLRELKKQHPKEYWNILKQADGSRHREPKVSLLDFEKHFKNLNLNETPSSTSIPDFDPGEITTTHDGDINQDFTLEEVMNNVRLLKNNKSEGWDFVKNEYIKNSPNDIFPLVVALFNLILKTGHVPYDWCIGLIIPIFKRKGSPLDANNYRGITLLSCLGKLWTSCINSRLTKYVKDRSIIGEEQAGFREGYSTNDHVFVLNELINIYIQKKKRLYCCFIDYQKAFDTINRSALWGKLIANEINGPILKVIYNMYESAKSCVKEQSKISGLFACNMGVRQGDNLSPLLFAIFLNDFEVSLSSKYNGLTAIEQLSRIYNNGDIDFFINLYTLLYADDTLALAESPEELQLAMNEIHDYCSKWELSINQTKTKVVIFSKGKVKKHYKFKIGNIDISTTSEYCYLGILFNFNGKLTKAITERITPARKAMFGLNEKAARLLLPPDIHIDLFEKMIAPIFLYGCEVWGYGNIEPLEVFYRKFIKRVLGLSKATPNCIVYGEVGKRPLVNLIYIRMLSFWVKVSEGRECKLSSLIYKLIYRMHLGGEYDSPWLMCIKAILCNSGNPYFWFGQEYLAPKHFMCNVVSLQLEDQYLQGWNFEVNRNRRCIIYRILKDKPSLEKYFSYLNFSERRTLCKFRTGNHKLPVTESRYLEGGGGVDSYCKLCDGSDICDEYHVLFTCKHFEDHRKKYLKKYYYTKPSTFKMYSLFNSNHKQISNLAKFLKYILAQF